MDAALAAVIGAGIGAGATVLGSLLTSRQQASQQETADLRRRKEVAYSSAIRSLLRARNRRSAMDPSGATYIAKEDIGMFFDDLVEAQHSLAVLTTACGPEQRQHIERASSMLNSTVDAIVQLGPHALSKKELRSGPAALEAIYDDVVAVARDDIGPRAP